MATRQQLRGDGSKEYQIITNLSRGINNAVADDVLVDNAFRDVVNFSSDQLGNISKRDNLLNSNFKEFIRKLAYGDFNLNRFKIKTYNDYNIIDGYKRYSFGSADQVKLQNFYEDFFTNKHYISNQAFTTYSGLVKDKNGELVKVPTYVGAPTIRSDGYLNQKFPYRQLTIDTEIKDYTNRQKDKFLPIRKSQLTYHSNGGVSEVYELSWQSALTGDIIPILNSSVPNGWLLKEDNTVMYKEYAFLKEPEYHIENIEVTLNNEERSVVQTSAAFYVQSGSTYKYMPKLLIEENDNDYDFYLYSGEVEMQGIDGDYGWEVVDKSIDSINFKALHKKYLKADITANTIQDLKFLGKKTNDVDTVVDIKIYFSDIDTAGLGSTNYYRFSTNIIDAYNTVLNNVYIVNQNNFFKSLQNLDKLFKEGNYEGSSSTLDEPISFEAWFIGITDYYSYEQATAVKVEDIAIAQLIRDTSSAYINKGKSLSLYKFKFELDADYNLDLYINSRLLGDDFLVANTENKTLIPLNEGLTQQVDYNDDPDVLNNLFISRYINSLYIATGKSSIIEIKLDEASASKSITHIGELNDMEVTSSGNVATKTADIYYPVPYEVSNPGFNLLAENPLEAIETAGNADKIRGVFYTTTGRSLGDGKVLQSVPCNIPFYIHVISTGNNNPNVPQIRPNNGELDEGKNPYTNLPGEWVTQFTDTIPIFKCTGIDTIENYEMKITKGDDDYITYFTPEPYVEENGDMISTVRNLLLKCTRSKIINNQLVLFGNSGYIFFSDFENFKYFPNYYYVYVPTDLNEKVIDIVYFRQFYAVFTNKRIFRMSGDFAADNFETGPLNDFMGCVNHSTIRQVYNSLYFIGYNGIYALNQGYLGSGTENLKRIDTQLTNTFNFDNVSYCYVMGNTYIIIMNDGKTWYTYDVDNDMFLRYDYSLGDNSTLSNVSFIETLEENQIYAVLTTNKEGKGFANDLLLYNFPLSKDVNYDYKDSDQGYISAFETPYINLGTPTNTKKFKNLFIKMYNETDSLIPLYVTVYVDDILAITPEDYTIELDEETNTYFYYFKVDNNAELLKAHNLLGELTLGKDTLGDNIIQQLKLKINAKGRAIKIILADGYDYPNKDNSAIIKYRNNKKFSISTIGIVYKLKKVKEG